MHFEQEQFPTMSSTTTNYQPLITSLASKISSVSQVIATQTSTRSRLLLSYEQLQASYQIYSNDEIIATATQSSVIQSASSAIAKASATLEVIHDAQNTYAGETPSLSGNLTYTIIFAILFILHIIWGLRYKQWWFTIAFFGGIGLEMAGFIGRSLSHSNDTNDDYFLLQIISLTIAPAFIMGGIYNLLMKFIVIYGSKFALMRPMLYSYIFIICDIISLVVQAAGGAIASMADTKKGNELGTHIMVGGMVFQIISMSVYMILFLQFFLKVKFFNIQKYKQLEFQFDPNFAHVRSRKLFKSFPYIIFICVVLVFIRCVYRVVELAQGWTGYLISHEIYLFTLDALMIALTAIILIVVHPGVVFDGRNTKIKVSHKKRDIQQLDHDIKLKDQSDFRENSIEASSAGSRRDII